jgi:hypothetical protein
MPAILISLAPLQACPLGMAALMGVPALARRRQAPAIPRQQS